MTSYNTCCYPDCYKRIPYDGDKPEKYCSEHNNRNRSGLVSEPHKITKDENIPKETPMVILRCPICKQRYEFPKKNYEKCDHWCICGNKLLSHKDKESNHPESKGYCTDIEHIAKELRIAISYPRPHTSTPNLHTCVHKEIRNDVEFCHYHDSPTDPTAIRNDTLDKVIEWVDNADNHTKDPGNGKHYVCLPDLIIFTESLRTQQEKP